MRIVWSVICVALMGLVLAGRPAGASEGFDDVAKLAKSGVTEDVLLKFVTASPVAFDLTVDEILYLTDLGVTPKAINAIMNHGKELSSGKTADTTADTTTETAEKTTTETTNELDEDAEQATTDTSAAETTTGDAEASATDKALGPIAESEGDGKLILASPLSAAVLHEQESVGDTVAAPVQVTAPEEGAVTPATFYETLTPYGTWIRIDDVWCWQPTVTVCDPQWQPYCDRGHWVSTDCGWLWQSDYSWGWAPFHYGRWKRCAGYGWLWTPDTVWSPAWVSWRECDSHYGWAPLPPSCGYDVDLGFSFRGRHFGLDIGFGLGLRDFCFVASDRFCDFSLRRHRVPRIECGAIFNRTTIIQNNITVVNSRVTVNGPGFARIQKQSGRTIPQLRIADARIGAGQALTRTSHEDRRNGTLQIYRPQVKKVTNETPATIARRQLATHVTQTSIPTNPKVLATSRQADEIRARQLAAQEARRQTAETLQRSRVQGTALKSAELEQQKIQKALGNEQNAARKAELAAKLEAQRTNAENARKQKLELESKATDERKRTLELAQQRNQALKAKATADAARAASENENKARLEAQRKAQQDAVAARQANLDAQKKAQQDAALRQAQENKAKLENQRKEADARQAQLESQRKAQQEAARQNQLKAQQEAAAKQAQAEAQRKAQQDAAAARQSQLEAQRKAQLEAQRQSQLKAQQEAAAKQAQLEAQRKAQQDAAAARQVQLDAQRRAQQEAAQQQQLKAQQEASARQAQQQAQQSQLQAQRQAQQEAAAARQAQQQQAAAARQAQIQAQQAQQAQLQAQRQAQLQQQQQARSGQNDDPFSSRRRR